jgi:hypothetical protein
MTDERFMNSLRSEPRPEYARSLWRRLQASVPNEEPDPARGFRFAPALAFAVLVVAVGSLVMFPSVRASAQAFLDLFRVRSFVAVQFDPTRAEKLRNLDQNEGFVVFDRKEKIQEPGAPVDAPSRASAEAAIGIPVLEPVDLPNGYTREKFQTMGDGRLRLGTSTERVQAVLQAVDVRDVQVPPGLDGQWIDVHVNPVARQVWVNGERRIALIQARSPEVSLPAGLDLARLGEIGLRILGLDATEARRLASTIDWNSTLVVPVPANATSFREISVRGHKALSVSTQGSTRPDGTRIRDGSVLLWTENDRVFALSGPVDSSVLVKMAESLR